MGPVSYEETFGCYIPGILYDMRGSGQIYPNRARVIPLKSTGMDVRRAAFIWKVMMNPNDIQMEDIYNVFFDAVMGVSRMRYFNPQSMAHEHEGEERAINNALCEDVIVGGSIPWIMLSMLYNKHGLQRAIMVVVVRMLLLQALQVVTLHRLKLLAR